MWQRVCDTLHGHRKVANIKPELMPACMGLWVLSLSWVGSALTTGRIPAGMANRLIGRDSAPLADELVRVGLWERTDDGYYIHDYPIFNFTAEEVEGMREQRSEAGKKSAEVRWNNRKVTKRSTSRSTTCSTKPVTQRCSDPDPDPNSPILDPVPDPEHSEAVEPTAPALPPDFKRLLDHHATNFKTKFNCNLPVVGVKDIPLCKKMIETYGIELSLKISDQLFSSKDAWISTTGYTVGVLWASSSKLAVEINKPKKQYRGLTEADL